MNRRYCPECYQNLKRSKRFEDTYVCKRCGERYSFNATLSRRDLETIFRGDEEENLDEYIERG